MKTNRIVLSSIGACLVGLALGQPARADILITIDKSTQHMIVKVDGRDRYNWPVSTGKPGYDTPSGTFRPFRMDINHVSKEYDDAPMPYSIFFTASGIAVHGTNQQRHLGRAASHGCVRLSVKNAAVLWDLVKRELIWNTVVQVRGASSRWQSDNGRGRQAGADERNRFGAGSVEPAAALPVPAVPALEPAADLAASCQSTPRGRRHSRARAPHVINHCTIDPVAIRRLVHARAGHSLPCEHSFAPISSVPA